MGAEDIRQYEVRAATTDTFGRVACSSRNHHFIIDGPIQNGCPGEALTPVEIFLSGVAACGVELIQVIGKEQNIRVDGIKLSITGVIDRGNPVHKDITVFNSVLLRFRFLGINETEALQLVDGFRARCPLYGTVAMAVPQINFEIETEARPSLHSINLEPKGGAATETRSGLHSIKLEPKKT